MEPRFFSEFSKFALFDKQGTISGGKKWVSKTLCNVNIRIKFFDATLHPVAASVYRTPSEQGNDEK